MFDLKKATLLTNNDKVYEKYKDKLKCIYENEYRDILLRARDYIYDRNKLLTHPQASSLKPNQTPYRSILVYEGSGEDNTADILLIEKCIEVFLAWQDIAKTPKNYKNNIKEDFKTIDLSIVDNIMDRII